MGFAWMRGDETEVQRTVDLGFLRHNRDASFDCVAAARPYGVILGWESEPFRCLTMQIWHPDTLRPRPAAHGSAARSQAPCE